MTREEQILDAATKLFSERSFDGVGVDAIAKESGITGSAIYRHFTSKDEILSVLFDRATDALLVRIGQPLADPRDELHRLVYAHIEFSLSMHQLAGIWAREQRALSDVHRRNHLRRQRQYTDRWIDCLDACYPGHPREDLAATVRAMHGLITSDITRPHRTARPPHLPELLASLAFAALDSLQSAVP
ncbi:TetR/AcrR family transcriptional regulator [Rhodococcus sp. IEGM 1305]|uniref:TetR/AcrR family transcriptional regulator n=1 Tax=Rhodococcus sp. IEGM 1305 TaxID=3047092 RepID=UPI0024B703BB|nr:TetR/AcrR family transcriptional regulator [Rhodococcus sp. IEGM 1305]MDI9953653.1 TetR/AcrR family transcriptional regulator [Rhodococcus sp. IEGM 1305]